MKLTVYLQTIEPDLIRATCEDIAVIARQPLTVLARILLARHPNASRLESRWIETDAISSSGPIGWFAEQGVDEHYQYTKLAATPPDKPAHKPLPIPLSQASKRSQMATSGVPM